MTIFAKYKGEYREVFNVRKSGDESIYLMASSDYNPHISVHKSGVLHVTYPFRDGKKIRVAIEGGQPLSSFVGCSSPNEYVIEKAQFCVMKRKEIAMVSGDLDDFTGPIIAVAFFLFDPTSKGLFESQASKFKNAVIKTIESNTPNIGLVAYEH